MLSKAEKVGVTTGMGRWGSRLRLSTWQTTLEAQNLTQRVWQTLLG